MSPDLGPELWRARLRINQPRTKHSCRGLSQSRLWTTIHRSRMETHAPRACSNLIRNRETGSLGPSEQRVGVRIVLESFCIWIELHRAVDSVGDVGQVT